MRIIEKRATSLEWLTTRLLDATLKDSESTGLSKGWMIRKRREPRIDIVPFGGCLDGSYYLLSRDYAVPEPAGP